jgi:hypothetical protein
MSIEAPRRPCYLVEWYMPELTAAQLDVTAARLEECAATMFGGGSPVQLLMTLAVPDDEVVFGVFAAGSAQAVSEACRRARVPAERLTNAWTLASLASRRQTPDTPANPATTAKELRPDTRPESSAEAHPPVSPRQ